MKLEKRIEVLVRLGDYIMANGDALQGAMLRSKLENAWFTLDTIGQSLTAIAEQFLNEDKLRAWLSRYSMVENPKKVALVMAGNIPLVGFHDFLCVFVSGHVAQIKVSSKDKHLMEHLLKVLVDLDGACAPYIELVERLKGFDAVIATGSGNSNRYFEHYFGKYPHILRSNRSSVAVLTGEESAEDLANLGKDIFSYFGLGCRNVSKLFVPKDYDFVFFLDSLQGFSEIQHHNKYKNNFDYQFSLLLLNRTPHYVSKFVLLTEDERVVSPISVVHYEVYEGENWREKVQAQSEVIQCCVGAAEGLVPFGEAQLPTLWDYADGVDVLGFLLRF